MRSGSYVLNEPADTGDNGEIASPRDDQVCLTKMPEDITALPSSSRAKKNSVYRSALTKLLCGLYALLLVVFGVVFAVANALTVEEREHKFYLEQALLRATGGKQASPRGFIEHHVVWVFLLYLYVGSLLVLLYFQIGILRGVRVRNNYFENNLRVVIRRSQDNLQLSPSSVRKVDGMLPPSQPQTPTGPGDRIGDARDLGEVEGGKKEPLDQMSTTSNASVRSQMVLPGDGEVAHVGEGINFYLRLGALAFSIGSVTLDGFHIASYFETDVTATCESPIFTLVYVLHLIFTFVQTFFLFKNHKLVIDKNKPAVRFGLMHLLATNLCVWVVTAVMETADDFRQQDYIAKVAANLTDMSGRKSCYEDMTLARIASPYLFPCTIIYSIIAAGIIYRMYQYVGVKIRQRWPSHTSLTSSAPHGTVSMDCEKANKGLFTGLLIAVVTLIAIATFFVFESRLGDPHTAINVFYVMELTLLTLTGICIVFGHMRLCQLKFQESYFLSVDSVLLIVSLGGAYIYLCFMLISAASTIQTFGVAAILSLVTISVAMVQSTVQAIFILDGLCRCAENDGQVERKPGRAMVTFLLVCNLALWVVGMFEIKKTMVVPFHQSFYGILSWNVMLHLCVPLFIFFRFHSAICLSKIWYQAYQKEKQT